MEDMLRELLIEIILQLKDIAEAINDLKKR
jgi:hypothetical protein